MKYCLDEGRTHFLCPWPGREFVMELSAGENETLHFLARGEEANFAVHLDGNVVPSETHKPCHLGDSVFRWMTADLPERDGTQQLCLKMEGPNADLASDASTGLPVVRVSDKCAPESLRPCYDDPALPSESILNILPEHLRELRHPDWPQAWAVSCWIQSAWTYRNTYQGQYYCPWQIGEILRWGRRGHGPDDAPVIAMCVHYAVAFQQCCLALGTPARLIPLMPNPNTDSGHFVAEIWSRSLRKWVLIDPQAGLCFLDDSGLLLNAREVRTADNPRTYARCGIDPENLRPVAADFPFPYACSAELFRHVGVWRWADFHTRPEHAGVGHGTTAYAETAILWLETCPHPPMFPYCLSQEAYDAHPGRAAARSENIFKRVLALACCQSG